MGGGAMRPLVYFLSAFFASLATGAASHGDIPSIDLNAWIYLSIGALASGFAALKAIYDSKTTDKQSYTRLP